MYKKIKNLIKLLIISFMLSNLAFASEKEMKELQSEIQKLKQLYEKRITELESKLSKVEKNQNLELASTPKEPANIQKKILGNKFNPSIGIILNGQYSSFSASENEHPGFAFSHEGERPPEGFSLKHTEINFSANIDDKFLGSFTLGMEAEQGETEVEIEEAYIKTLPGFNLPVGMSVKVGRALWTLGYLNEHHQHTDDFVDRPLPYRFFLNGAYNDDGLEVSYLLPTDLFVEIGGGAFRGDDYPFGVASGSGFGAYSAFARVGGDISKNISWRLGANYLSGKADAARDSNDDELAYIGDTDILAFDFRYIYTPSNNQELIFQTEYFERDEKGQYTDDSLDDSPSSGVNASSSGWYSQLVYKFTPQWRIGLRYSKMDPISVSDTVLADGILDSHGYKPKALSFMADWTNSEFSRIRFQYNKEDLENANPDDQFMIQYIMSLGAHTAHKF